MENSLNAAAEILLLIFMVITFLQSGIDKIIDWKGNLGWLKGHFEKSPLGNMVPALLMTVLLVEIAAGILCSIGAYQIMASGKTEMALYGAVTSCIALLMLLFGQRVAKDYAWGHDHCCLLCSCNFLGFLVAGIKRTWISK